METVMHLNGLAVKGSGAILDAYAHYQSAFTLITSRANRRFEARDWYSTQRDSIERLELYPRVVRQIVSDLIEKWLGENTQTDSPRTMVRSFSTLIPHKRIAELYISIGYNRHGKTELYRDLMRHLKTCSDYLVIAEDERGR